MDTAEFLFPRDLEVTPTGIERVLFIGSCLSEAYVKRFREANPSVQYEHILFNNAADLPPRSDLEIAQYDLQYIQLPIRSVLTDAVIRIADNDKRKSPIVWLDVGRLQIDRMLEKAMTYNTQAGLLSIVSTFIIPQGNVIPSLSDAYSDGDLRWIISGLNAYLADRVRQFKNAYVADAEIIASTLGKRFFLDDFIGFYTHGSVHYPDWREGGRIEPVPPFVDIYENRLEEFFAAVFRQIEVIYRITKQLDQVKVVIFDLDNTLWRGQLVEQYQAGMQWPHSAGWPLGVWEAVHQLRWRGIVTALASKNDHEIVVAKWTDAVNPPFVKFEDFIARQINWRPKAENIAAILQKLSLTPKSAVFVDDHPVEREAVKAALPGIRTIGSNPYLTRRILLWSAETQVASRTDESKRREGMLSQQIQREQERSSMSRDAFLASLTTTLNLWEVTDTAHQSFTRVSELVNKTNQFNTTTRRWDLQDYRTFWQSGGHLFAFSVTDRFTDYGVVGVIFARADEVVQYVMSCRVLGMEVEIAALGTIVQFLRSAGVPRIVGSIIPTDVNMPCRDVFTRSGFREVDAHRFELNANKPLTLPSHVRVNFAAPAGDAGTEPRSLVEA